MDQVRGWEGNDLGRVARKGQNLSRLVAELIFSLPFPLSILFFEEGEEGKGGDSGEKRCLRNWIAR